MNKLIKSLYLSIILSGILYIVYYYFIPLENNYLIFIGIFIVLFSIIFFIQKIRGPKYSKQEVIERYNLPVKKEESLMISPKELVVENIADPMVLSNKEVIKKESLISKKNLKKSKEIPKQNVSYKNYANVFKSINQNLIDEKKIEKESEENSSEK